MTKHQPRSLWLPMVGELFISGARPLLAIFLALLVSAVLIIAAGADPIEAYIALADGAVGNALALANTAVRAAPLLLGGLGFAFGLKAGLVNVGIEGQMYAGAATATAVGIIPLPVPPWLHLTLAVMAGFVGGVVWGMIPGYLRAFRGISEIVMTLMLNYVGILMVGWLVTEPGPLADKEAFFPMSPVVFPSAQLPRLARGTSLHAGIIVGLVIAVILYFLLRYSPFGFRTRMVGANPESARYAGADVSRQILLVMLLSSGLGGLAGAGEVLGLKLRLFDSFVGGVGYEAIAVALLANNSPLGVILTAFFFGALKAGANKMQIVAGIETSIVLIIQALSVAFIIAIGFAERKRYARLTQKESKAEEAGG